MSIMAPLPCSISLRISGGGLSPNHWQSSGSSSNACINTFSNGSPLISATVYGAYSA